MRFTKTVYLDLVGIGAGKNCYIPISLNSNIPFSPYLAYPARRFYLLGDRRASRLGKTSRHASYQRSDTIDQTQLAASDVSFEGRAVSTIGGTRRRARAAN